ncbi:D-alanyl-D-alanine carboxypeptidase, partial [Bacillus cereus]|nr:D-alanyl-D-alanine carboxypeptidase [Bacillus cereus]
MKLRNKLNGHHIRRKFSASFLMEVEGRFRSYFKRPSIHLYKKCQKDVGGNMRRICVIITLLMMYASVMPIPTYAKMNSNVSARNAVLMEQQSGRVLYGKAEHE